MISSSNCAYQIQTLKHQINVTLKEIRKTVDVSREKEIDDVGQRYENVTRRV